MPSPAPADAAHSSPTAESVNGRVTGALFFVGFGTLWLLLGLKGMHRATPLTLGLLALSVIVLLVACMALYRCARSLPPGTSTPEAEQRIKRMFTAVNIIQWVSVFAAVAILNVLHRPDYIAPIITVIVGLHLLPLAQSFGYRQHYVTGALLVLWGAGCMATVRSDRLDGTCSVGTGLLLLLSALCTLLRCGWQVRGVSGALPTHAAAA